MKNKLLFLLLFPTQLIFAQYYNDEALLYARTGITGTARSIGSAGAYGSVGADLGSMNINPAGLGLYRSTDFSLSAGLNFNKNRSEFLGSFNADPTVKPYFNQAGVAFTKILQHAEKKDEFSFNSIKLSSFTFGINYQKQANFERIMSFDSQNNIQSGISAYTDYLNANHLTIDGNLPPEILLAWEAFLINHDSTGFTSAVHSPLRQAGNVTTKGSSDQIDLAFGFNFNDKVYIGAGVGVPFVSYQYSSNFSEANTSGSDTNFINYTLSSSLSVTGIGVNAKFGVIYRPVTWIRIGLSYQIPTYYALRENYQVMTQANFDTVTVIPNALGHESFKYKFRSPMKGVASASFYLKDHGFFSIDYEIQNYGSSHFNFGANNNVASNDWNTVEKKYYTFGHVVRAGFEGAYKSLRVRAGYAFSNTPYKNAYNTVKGYSEVRNNITAGIGYRSKRFYADVAYVYGIMKDSPNPYADEVLKNKFTSNTLVLTLGWKIPVKGN